MTTMVRKKNKWDWLGQAHRKLPTLYFSRPHPLQATATSKEASWTASSRSLYPRSIRRTADPRRVLMIMCVCLQLERLLTHTRVGEKSRLGLYWIFLLRQVVSDAMLAELKECFLEAYDDNQDGRIDIREVKGGRDKKAASFEISIPLPSFFIIYSWPSFCRWRRISCCSFASTTRSIQASNLWRWVERSTSVSHHALHVRSYSLYAAALPDPKLQNLTFGPKNSDDFPMKSWLIPKKLSSSQCVPTEPLCLMTSALRRKWRKEQKSTFVRKKNSALYLTKLAKNIPRQNKFAADFSSLESKGHKKKMKNGNIIVSLCFSPRKFKIFAYFLLSFSSLTALAPIRLWRKRRHRGRRAEKLSPRSPQGGEKEPRSERGSTHSIHGHHGESK